MNSLEALEGLGEEDCVSHSGGISSAIYLHFSY